MHFTTYEFIVFFAIVCILNSLSALLNSTLRKISLILFSYYFYSLFEQSFLIFLLSISVITYFFSFVLINKQFTLRRIFLGLGIFNILFILIIFKYFDFIITNISLYFPQIVEEINIKDIIVPLGISYITFKSISLLIDIYRYKIKSINLIDIFLYLSFFPQLLAGPISRYNEIIPQFTKLNFLSSEFSYYAIRFCWGFFKKFIIVSAIYSNELITIFQLPQKYNAIDLLLGTYLFALYIYIDFSGYTDISNGISGMLGIRSPENFDKPYLSTSIQEYWRRWHISLSTWIKDYIYIPLGGNRVGKFRNYFNLIISMTLAGIWHGANLNFLIWGFLHGALLVIGRIFKIPKRYKWVSIILTFNLVAILWIFFNTSSLDVAINYFKGFTNFENKFALLNLTNIILLLICILIHNFERKILSSSFWFVQRFRFFYQGLLLGIILWLIFELAPETTPYFMYYQF